MRKKFVAVACAAMLALAMPALAFAADANPSPEKNPSANAGQTDKDDNQANKDDNEGESQGGNQNFEKPAASEDTLYHYSPSVDAVTGICYGVDDEGENFYVYAELQGAKDVQIKKTDKTASNFDNSKEYVKVQSFEITSKDFEAGDELVTIVWEAGYNAQGCVCYAYVEHGDGSAPEAFYLPVNKIGMVKLVMGNLSTVTFGLTEQTFDEAAATDFNNKYNNGGKAQVVKAVAADNGATSPKTGDAL